MYVVCIYIYICKFVFYDQQETAQQFETKQNTKDVLQILLNSCPQQFELVDCVLYLLINGAVQATKCVIRSTMKTSKQNKNSAALQALINLSTTNQNCQPQVQSWSLDYTGRTMVHVESTKRWRRQRRWIQDHNHHAELSSFNGKYTTTNWTTRRRIMIRRMF